LQFII